MKKIVCIVRFVVFLMPAFIAGMPEANAQVPGGCIPAPMVGGQPQRCWDGRMIPPQNVIITGNNPYGGMVGQQQPQVIVVQPGQHGQYGQQQIVVPRGVAPGQRFVQNVGGQRMECSLTDRAISAIGQGGLAGVLVWVGEKLTGARSHKASSWAAVIGGVSGATITCDPLAEERLMQVVSPSGAAPAAQQNYVPPHCKIDTGMKMFRFNRVSGVMINPEQCTRYREKLDPLPEESSMSLQ